MPLRARSLAALVAALWIAGPARAVWAAPPDGTPTVGEGTAREVSPPGKGPARRAPAIASLVVLPTAIVEGSGAPRAVRVEDTELGPLARDLDALLSDTVQDLGLSVVPPPPGASPGPVLGDADLLARARAAHAPVVLPSLRATASGEVEIRLAIALPSANAVQVRHEHVLHARLPLRAVVLLRDLLAKPGPAPAPETTAPAPAEKLAGRITLMANAAAIGGLAGFSIQRASGSDDPRLLYPLMITGAGVGLGAAYLASGEWETGTGDAWYFAAGAWWPTAAGHLIFQGRFAATRAERDRWVFGLVGSGVGASLATLGLALHPMSDAGAILAHSGGAAGMLVGALVEMGVRRSASTVPYSGMGYGAALGWLAAAAAATQVRFGRPAPRSTAAVGLPFAGVIGESRLGRESAPIVGLGYAGVIPLPR